MSIAAFALSKVGCGYIYGAKGQVCSEAFRRQQAAQYPEQAAHILGTGAKWDGKEVWECAQLTRAAAKTEGYDLPSGATSQWTKASWARTGTIHTLPAKEVCFLYRQQAGSSTIMAHTGIYLGDGTCVHARGTAYGVVHQNMEQYAWSHWASMAPAPPRHHETEGGLMGESMIIATGDGNPLKLRADPSTNNPYIDKLDNGTRLEVLDTQHIGGEVWHLVKAAMGQTGYVMGKYLKRSDGVPTDPVTAVVTLPKGVADALSKALRIAEWR